MKLMAVLILEYTSLLSKWLLLHPVTLLQNILFVSREWIMAEDVGRKRIKTLLYCSALYR